MKNTVELLGVYGSDLTHACSAWTSTSRELTEEKVARIPKLLKMLVEGSDGQSHGTPFEKSSLHFLVTTEIATHIHLLKHRLTSLNSESARYKELKEDKYYVPKDWPQEWQEQLSQYTSLGMKLYHECYKDLVNKYGIDKKRAKESSRFFRPYSTQITADVMFNFRSFVHFIKLRNSPSAQLEVRELAEEMLRLIKEEGSFKHSIEAWKL